MSITSRPYRLLSDHMEVYDFMTEIYERDWRNGVPAPFLEYALSSDWMDKSLVHRNRLWFDGSRIVASFPTSVNGEPSVNVKLTLVKTADGWRLDSPTY